MLSLIIPAWNEEPWLSRCLASVRCQGVSEPYEIIVVDNGSADRTPDVAREWGANVVVCMERGVAFARQAGLFAAHGEIVVQLDADSALPVGTLERFIRAFDDPSVVAVTGDAPYVPGGLGAGIMRGIYRLNKRMFSLLFRRPATILAGCFAARRSVLLDAGGFNLDVPHYGDEYGLIGRLRQHGRVVYDPYLVIDSSDRRFRGRFLRFFLIDFLVRTVMDSVLYRAFGRSPFGDRAAVRSARSDTPPGRGILRCPAMLGLVSTGFVAHAVAAPLPRALGWSVPFTAALNADDPDGQRSQSLTLTPATTELGAEGPTIVASLGSPSVSPTVGPVG